MNIRYGTKEDWKQIEKVLTKGFSRRNPSLESVIWVVGEVDNQIVSVGNITLINSKWFICDLTTLPEFRNKGYATQVTKKLVETALENKAIEVKIVPISPYSQKIAERLGFKEIKPYHIWRLNG